MCTAMTGGGLQVVTVGRMWIGVIVITATITIG